VKAAIVVSNIAVACATTCALLCATAVAAPARAAHDGLTGDMDCNACHTAESWKLSTGAGASGFDHDRTGFRLRGMHMKTSCTGCHTGAKPAETCDGCHRDPHEGRMDGQCYECHTAVAWSDTNALEQHRRTRMPLTGQHAITDCVSCHKRQAERTWTDLPVDCYACHQTEYHAASTHPNHDGREGGKIYPRDCGQCHNPIGWSLAVTDPSSVLSRTAQARDHDPYFQLSTGSHTAFDCASCHVDQRRAQAVRCDACHDDISLRTQHKARVTSDASSCLRCHPRGIRR
jgi:hypothetical protein